ncbi:solute carrier family 22 member 15-like [Dendronephthya gigantea]|uniref:solute carrier family 22 member 15-like n=1 Tax=Dendronephthya gigantea TaxID=151771 RepID=UPI00106B7D7E|nr:solute carrier family 22 member 15-like [Dendronephthya gigantea]
MEYDNILRKIGEFGPFQKKVFFILNSLSFFQCCQMFLLVFVGDKPRWRCSNVAIKPYLDKNLEYPCLKNGSACREISFDGEFTSVVSEWDLVCDQEYKANIAQSVMMLGCLIGVITAGRLSDRIGRRYVTIYSQLLAFALGVVTAFVQNYTQFLFVRFLCGLVVVGGNLSCFVIQSEIIGPSYRGEL